MVSQSSGGLSLIYKDFEPRFESKIAAIATPDDPAHDILHFRRVVALAKRLAQLEKADLNIVVPAAWLHDFVVIPKNDPRRSKASRLSAEAAEVFLDDLDYPGDLVAEILHAIEAHSFSAAIKPRTLEAKIVQDADRLDGLGAIGIARVFATAGVLRRPFYAETDPFCETRQPEDLKFTIDHFYQKLFRTAETLQTISGRREGEKRAKIMTRYLKDIAEEIQDPSP